MQHMTNLITIALSTEDRARLDRLISALENRAAQEESTTPDPAAEAITEALTEVLTKATEAPAEVETPTTEEPTVTLGQIQQKVVQLSAADNGKKKAKVREIIVAFSPTVSGLNDMPEKWSEIWDRLTALESEN
jgi:hypothetical protein